MSDHALSGSEKVTALWFEKFKSLKVSPKTGYNWNHISHIPRQPQTATTNAVRAPARTVVQVKQLVGYCGQSTIRTEVFRTEVKLSPTLESCVPMESVDLVLQCDASQEKVSFITVYTLIFTFFKI
jgi:hypothetical protein